MASTARTGSQAAAKTTRVVLVLAATLYAAPRPAASQEPAQPTTVDSLTAWFSGDTVRVSGTATFGGLAPVSVGTDPAGDGRLPAQLGFDLTEALIGQPDATSGDLRFVLRLADLPPTGGLPEAARYVWDLAARGADGEAVLLQIDGRLTDVAAGQSTRVPSFVLRGNCVEQAGEPTCEVVAALDAAMDAESDEITVTLPRTLLEQQLGGSATGATIEPAVILEGIAAVPSAVVSLRDVGDRVVQDPEADRYPLAAREVQVGLVPAGQPPGPGVPATLSGGSFVATLDGSELPPGPHEVWARACFGPNCATRTAPVLPSAPGELASTVIGLHAEDMLDVAIGDHDGVSGDREAYVADRGGAVTMWKKEGGAWASTVVWTGPAPARSIAAGDFDPSHPGSELAVATADAGASTIWELSAGAGVWTPTEVGETSTTVMDLAVGDVDVSIPGDELVAAGGGVWVLGRSGGKWTQREISSEGTYVGVGELDPGHPGSELAVLGPSETSLLVGSGTSWGSSPIAGIGATENIKSILVGDFDTSLPGNEVAFDREVTDTEGWVYEAYRSGGTWTTRVVYHVDGSSPADAPTVHHVHAMVLGEYQASHPGQELLLVTSHVQHAPGRAIVIAGSGEEWGHGVAFEGLDEFHGVAEGDLDPDRPGTEVLLVGHPSELVMLHRG